MWYGLLINGEIAYVEWFDREQPGVDPKPAPSEFTAFDRENYPANVDVEVVDVIVTIAL